MEDRPASAAAMSRDILDASGWCLSVAVVQTTESAAAGVLAPARVTALAGEPLAGPVRAPAAVVSRDSASPSISTASSLGTGLRLIGYPSARRIRTC